MAGPAGLEPVTSRVTGECSNQLSYGPVFALCFVCTMENGAGDWDRTSDLGLMSPTL